MTYDAERAQTIIQDERILVGALLWLRNHYDVGDHDLKPEVLERVDRVLKDYGLFTGDLNLFLKEYPPKS